MTFREQLINLPDGRVLEVATMGDPAGNTVFFHHGTPGSTKTMLAFEPLAESGELFFVTTSRAGYGQSSRLEARDMASVVDDTRHVLDALARGSYVALGWSGGGPHALACAALDAPRCLKAVILAGVAPSDVDFDWTEGMGPENLEEFALAQKGGPAYEAYMEASCAVMADLNKDNVVELMSGLLPQADRDVLAGDHERELFATGMRYGFVRDWRGYFDDNVAFLRPWGFDTSTIDVPVAVYFGDADLMVPPKHGHWLTQSIPKAVARHHAPEGHLSIFASHLDEVASDLSSAFTS
ncbi:MAG TPA: alpha/beta hydrolase [Acidimicrobiales bacterium]|nr:alpha/beta hydrolase [Acidimicrobiales bacterium]